MRVTVRLFAQQRAQTGLRCHHLELPEGADVAAAWAVLVADLPVIGSAADSVRFARNGTYVSRDEPLADGDELAVIPPVAGGAQASGERHRRIELREETLDDGLLDALRREVASPADGAVVVFVGQTRATPGSPAPGQEAQAARFAGQEVAGLTYEAFESMAHAVLGEVADEIESRFGIRRLAIVHRLGDVAVGESSVVIVVAGPHRAEAFEACRYALEELKARVPVWKEERFADGSVWLGSPPRTGPPSEPPPASSESQARNARPDSG